MERNDLATKYNITDEEFDKTGLVWDDLMNIYDDYIRYKPQLEEPARVALNSILKVEGVHSANYRIKKPEHLIVKIIRKKLDKPENNIDITNYKIKVTDLIGLRALHLFKEDWALINDDLRKRWTLAEKPIAYFRKGDSQELLKLYKEKKCKTAEHKHSYRSVHYLINISIGRTSTHVAEVQVRTLFEEGWSEIDHKVRYPFNLGNEMLREYLMIMNRLAGSADEMASFLKRFAFEQQQQLIKETESLQKLENTLNILNITHEEMDKLKKDFEEYKKNSIPIIKYDFSILSSIIFGLESTKKEMSKYTVDTNSLPIKNIKIDPQKVRIVKNNKKK